MNPMSPMSPIWFELIAELIEAEVPESDARELVDAARAVASPGTSNLPDARKNLIAELDRIIPDGHAILVDPGRPRTVALVGPTGVGKTTTIAKLAANFRVRDQRRVGLITVDTYRIAAVEQLRTYAEIMDLPMEVVSTPRQMADAIARFADLDLILIDTAGHSPHDAIHLQQLKSLLAEAKADEIQLVISSVASTPHLKQIVRKFQLLTPTSLIITKLDEATGLGNLVPVMRQAALPVSYLTCGQSVPDDIVLVEKLKLLPVMLGQQPIASLV
jgi:flagellar biosynthesis protein FlhF